MGSERGVPGLGFRVVDARFQYSSCLRVFLQGLDFTRAVAGFITPLEGLRVQGIQSQGFGFGTYSLLSSSG